MDKTAKYFNRDVSWVEFNARVLDEALQEETPLLEKLKFLAIVSSNFDEFFMVRVASAKRQLLSGDKSTCPSGLKPSKQLKIMNSRIRNLIQQQYAVLTKTLFPEMEKEGISYVSMENYTSEEKEQLDRYFDAQIFPLLTPVRVEQGSDFPFVTNLRQHTFFTLESVQEPGKVQYALVQVPPSADRFIFLDAPDKEVRFTLIEEVMLTYAFRLFPGYKIVDSCLFRVTRDADLGVDEERDDDFVEAMSEILDWRKTSNAVRLEVSFHSTELGKLLQEKIGLAEEDVFVCRGPLDLKGFFELVFLSGFDQLRDPVWKPVVPAEIPEDVSIWKTLKHKDVLLHHPYDSFSPVVRMVREGAADPKVLAIKMTLYRTSGDSPIVKALEEAAMSGKQVTVLVELKARFDEAQNIGWAERLQNAGAIVIYGISNLKVHSKALLIIRKESAGIRRYAHLGTGNYHDKTAKLYTDMGLLTANEELTYEAGLVFNAITGYSAIPHLHKILMAPINLKSRTLELIEREAARSSPESPGLIVAKINSLADPEIIETLYKASAAGVKIRLNVRGICTLVPGVKGLSENIEVVSVIDRYLEHTRAFYFANSGASEVYLASADWMPRNLDRRVELMFPVEQNDLKKRIIKALEIYFKDNQKAHVLDFNGNYTRVQSNRSKRKVRSQEYFYNDAQKRQVKLDAAQLKEFTVRRKPSESKI